MLTTSLVLINCSSVSAMLSSIYLELSMDCCSYAVMLEQSCTNYVDLSSAHGYVFIIILVSRKWSWRP